MGKIFFLPSKYSLFFKKWTADEKKYGWEQCSARFGINPNRSLGRLLFHFSLFQVCLCHISISLCSMTLLGLGRASKLPLLSLCVTFGILSTSLSRRSPLRLNFVDVAVARQRKLAFSALALRNVRQLCGQSARNKY